MNSFYFFFCHTMQVPVLKHKILASTIDAFQFERLVSNFIYVLELVGELFFIFFIILKLIKRGKRIEAFEIEI